MRGPHLLGLLAVGMLVPVLLVAGGSEAGAATGGSSTAGYWLLGGDGGVFSFNAPYLGMAGDPQCGGTVPSHAPYDCFTAIGATPDGGGYTIVNPTSYLPSPLGTGPPAAQLGNATGAASCTVHFSDSADPSAVET